MNAPYFAPYQRKGPNPKLYQALCLISIVLSLGVLFSVAIAQLVESIEDWITVGLYYLLKVGLTLALLKASISDEYLDCFMGMVSFLYGFFDVLCIECYVFALFEEEEYKKYWYILIMKGIESLFTFIVTATGNYDKCMMKKQKPTQFETMPTAALPPVDSQNFRYVLVQLNP